LSAEVIGESCRDRFDVPGSSGTYVLRLTVHWETAVEVGSLGEITFQPGIYLYCGSALGPGGLAARIAHHSRFAKSPRWHIDYLTFAGYLSEVWYVESDEKLEHRWAEIFQGIEWVEDGPGGFGSSDCGCATHLFYTKAEDIFDIFSESAGGGIRRAFPLR
jgi:Uri superfamily endonuclease